jgi:hypothetical protein
MHFDKRLDIEFKCFIRQQMFTVLPVDFPSLRDLCIQNGKLQRMLADTAKGTDHFFAMESTLAGGSIKKLKREQGKKTLASASRKRK